MKRYPIIYVFLAGLLLFTACGPAGTSPAETAALATTAAPTATMAPTVTLTPTATMAPETTPIPVDLLSPAALQEAMFAAARADDVVAMRQYIAGGADINEESDLGVTVLGIAAIRGNEEMIKVLLDAGAAADVASFQFAVLHSNDNVEIVQAFIDHGADINAASSAPGHTALMNAGEKGYIQVGKLLLANGADINKGDDYNDPALNVAAFHGQLEFVKMLVEMGAELNVRGMGNRTAVGHALIGGHADVADFLKQVGGTE
jgi:ankyrin repeat protein